MPAQPERNRLYIAGGPGGSSIGPPIHEHIAQSLDLQWTCSFLQLPTISDVMSYFRAPNFAGGIVTMPHKRTVIPFLHHCDDLVQILGACNFVYLTPSGELHGTNTDWVGIDEVIRTWAPAPAHTQAIIGMVYGAGGASRAAVYALSAKLHCETVYVVNRDDGEVAELLRDVHTHPDLYYPEIVHVRSVAEARTLPPPYYVVCTVPDCEAVTGEEREARDVLVEFLGRDGAERGLLVDMCYHPAMTRNLELGVKYGWEIVQGFTVVAAQFACATGGIGLEVSRALAQAGADIVSIEVPRDPASPDLRRAIEETGRSITVFECNIKDPQSIKETFAAIWKSEVVPDILFNCAGITRIMPIVDTKVEDIDNVMAINFRGTYLTIQEFGRELLQRQRPGKIINFASIAAFLAQTDISVYCSSKAAVQNLTRAVSNEWAGKGITCNAICPGFVHTKMCEDLYQDEEFSAKVVARTSMGRWSTPQDLKGLAVFLASAASDFITGESIFIDGGIMGR
ncbi:hypothetical protein FE257_012414 [Aspergillus nanangensis]|uniref:Shikimate dehydrogenase substrate binding N-terminal domain-containing protein n=1 Tax=Aspergillus nanangensis TaxID=2582783 RepID=A0AAD4CV32_ASPNN|nr:hypothetical protein FE257_012414 [Aspergillus nanangensis]